jgi:hypothetical protein
VLEGAYERIIIGDCYGDIELGLFVIRGENVVLLGRLVRHPPSSLHPALTPLHSHPYASATVPQPVLPSHRALSEMYLSRCASALLAGFRPAG